MLDKVVALELIMPTLERQIRPYMKEHGLNQDKIFSKYIKVRLFVNTLVIGIHLLSVLNWLRVEHNIVLVGGT